MDDSLIKFINSKDPLSVDAIEYLINYKEEALHIDYKESFETDSNKAWIELAKDIMAFANSYGGYLLFGVQDNTFNLIGLSDSLSATLKNIDFVQQKINRYVEPEILNIRSKEYTKDDRIVVVLFIPESLSKTYVSREGCFTFPSGKNTTILHKGTIYVRHSGGNHLCRSNDIDELVTKRLRHFKENLLSNISRVVEAPPESNVYILSQDPNSELNNKFIIEDAPEAIKIKGMCFTISPETPEQEILAWISMFKNEATAMPPSKTLWNWYSQRESLNLSEEQRLAVAKFCLVSDVPAFFWIQDCTADLILTMLEEATVLISTKTRVDIIVGMAAFLGKSIFSKIVNKIIAKHKDKLPKYHCNFPSSDPYYFFNQKLVESSINKGTKNDKETIRINLERLNEIAKSAANKGSTGSNTRERYIATAIDCFLYAQGDKYKTKR